MKIHKNSLRELRELAGVVGAEASRCISVLVEGSIFLDPTEEYISGILPRGNKGEVWVIWFSHPTPRTFFRLSRNIVRAGRRCGFQKLCGTSIEALENPMARFSVSEDLPFFSWEVSI